MLNIYILYYATDLCTYNYLSNVNFKLLFPTIPKQIKNTEKKSIQMCILNIFLKKYLNAYSEHLNSQLFEYKIKVLFIRLPLSK